MTLKEEVQLLREEVDLLKQKLQLLEKINVLTPNPWLLPYIPNPPYPYDGWYKVTC